MTGYVRMKFFFRNQNINVGDTNKALKWVNMSWKYERVCQYNKCRILI